MPGSSSRNARRRRVRWEPGRVVGTASSRKGPACGTHLRSWVSSWRPRPACVPCRGSLSRWAPPARSPPSSPRPWSASRRAGCWCRASSGSVSGSALSEALLGLLAALAAEHARDHLVGDRARAPPARRGRRRHHRVERLQPRRAARPRRDRRWPHRAAPPGGARWAGPSRCGCRRLPRVGRGTILAEASGSPPACVVFVPYVALLAHAARRRAGGSRCPPMDRVAVDRGRRGGARARRGDPARARAARSTWLVAVLALVVVVAASVVDGAHGDDARRATARSRRSSSAASCSPRSRASRTPSRRSTSRRRAAARRCSAPRSTATRSTSSSGLLVPAVVLGIAAPTGATTLVATWYVGLTLVASRSRSSRRGCAARRDGSSSRSTAPSSSRVFASP